MAGSVAPGRPLLPLLLVLAAATAEPPPPAGEVRQSPLYTVTPEGGSVDITCTTHGNGTLLGVHLRQGHLPTTRKVTFFDGAHAPTVDARFRGRVLFSGPTHNLTVTVQRLRPPDSGAYFCEAILEEGKGWGAGTTLVVTDTPPPAASACPGVSQAPIAFPVALALALGVGGLLVVLGLAATCVLRRRQMGSVCWARDRHLECVIYEDMSCSSQSTVSVPGRHP